jgi:hypothetical protein
MPCDMYRGVTSEDFAWADVREALKRVAALEQALCGLCQRIFSEDKFARLQSFDLAAWFNEHKKHPGCDAGRSKEEPVAEPMTPEERNEALEAAKKWSLPGTERHYKGAISRRLISIARLATEQAAELDDVQKRLAETHAEYVQAAESASDLQCDLASSRSAAQEMAEALARIGRLNSAADFEPLPAAPPSPETRLTDAYMAEADRFDGSERAGGPISVPETQREETPACACVDDHLYGPAGRGSGDECHGTCSRNDCECSAPLPNEPERPQEEKRLPRDGMCRKRASDDSLCELPVGHVTPRWCESGSLMFWPRGQDQIHLPPHESEE